MDPSVYTSEYVCDRIAERSVAKYRPNARAGTELMRRIVMPFGERLRGRAKVATGVLKEVNRAIVKRLSIEDSIVDVYSAPVHSSRLSSNEAYDIRYIMVLSNEDDDMMEFVAGQIMLTRREMVIALTSTDFFVHRHALGRFLQRERKEPGVFLKAAIEPAILSPIIGAATAYRSDSENIALPIGNGMLLGKLEVYSSDNPTYLTRMTFAAGAPPVFEDLDRSATLVKDRRLIIKMLTYVDADAMTDSRTDLHDLLCTYVDEHGHHAQEVFNMLMFSETQWSDEFVDSVSEKIRSALDHAARVVDSRAWVHFSKTARKG